MEVMEPVKFTIDIEAPLGGPAPELREHLQGSPTWRYRVLSLEAQRLESSVYHITLLIHPDDIHKETDLYELFAFRDRLLSLVSVSAMVPVRMRTTGGFHFALGNRQYEMISLGPTGGEYAPSPLLSLRPLLEGLSASENLAAVIYFIWQAINASDASEAIYRFINIAICVELLASMDSPEPTSINPRCPNRKCNYVLKHCPRCSHKWKIPNSLGNRVRFLLPDASFRSRVIRARNKVMHGAQRHWQPEFIEELESLSIPLMVVARNHVGSKIGLPSISEADLSLAVDAPQITLRINYTVPEERQD